MRRNIWIAAITLFVAAPIGATAQQASQSAQSQGQAQNQTNAQAAPAQASAGQSSSAADAASKARQDQTSAQKTPMVFTNANLPRSSPISVVGVNGPPASSASIQARAAADEKSDERMWRQKFADARHTLQEDRQKLSMLQSEFSALGMVRYFNENDAVTKQQAIADQHKQISADQKAIDDLRDNLKKAGGDPAWAR